jgi:hypothetical protein
VQEDPIGRKVDQQPVELLALAQRLLAQPELGVALLERAEQGAQRTAGVFEAAAERTELVAAPPGEGRIELARSQGLGLADQAAHRGEDLEAQQREDQQEPAGHLEQCGEERLPALLGELGLERCGGHLDPHPADRLAVAHHLALPNGRIRAAGFRLSRFERLLEDRRDDAHRSHPAVAHDDLDQRLPGLGAHVPDRRLHAVGERLDQTQVVARESVEQGPPALVRLVPGDQRRRQGQAQNQRRADGRLERHILEDRLQPHSVCSHRLTSREQPAARAASPARRLARADTCS